MNIRKSIRYGAIAALSVLSLSAFAWSQHGSCEQQGMQGMHGKGGQHQMAGMGHHPGMGMALHRLSLTDEQHNKVFELMQSQMRQQHESMRASRKAHEALHQLTREPGFDVAKAKALTDELGQLKAQQLLRRAQTESQLRALLTPEQRKALDEGEAQSPSGPRMMSGHHS